MVVYFFSSRAGIIKKEDESSPKIRGMNFFSLNLNFGQRIKKAIIGSDKRAIRLWLKKRQVDKSVVRINFVLVALFE